MEDPRSPAPVFSEKALFSDPPPSVKKTLLKKLSEISTFTGSESTHRKDSSLVQTY